MIHIAITLNNVRIRSGIHRVRHIRFVVTSEYEFLEIISADIKDLDCVNLSEEFVFRGLRS